jgi:hypothetical protein
MTDERMARLERANLRLTAAVAALGLSGAVLVGAGAVQRGPGQVRASRFVLVRPDGGEAAAWAVAKDGRGVSLDMNAGGKGGLILMSTGADGTASLEVDGRTPDNRIEATVDEDGASFSVVKGGRAAFHAP